LLLPHGEDFTDTVLQPQVKDAAGTRMDGQDSPVRRQSWMSLSRIHARTSSPKGPLGAEPWIKAASFAKSLLRSPSDFHVTVTAFSGGESTPGFSYLQFPFYVSDFQIMIFQSRAESPVIAEIPLTRPFARTASISRGHLSSCFLSAYSTDIEIFFTCPLFSPIPHIVPNASTSCTYQPVQSLINPSTSQS
jgi:hypothetical protein